MFTIVFFKTRSETVPVLSWLRSLPKEDRAVIGEDLRVAQEGFPLGMPLCRPLGKGLFEVRSSLPSRTEARLIFFQDGKDLIVVEGFIKKTRATPNAVIALSIKRKNDYLAAKNPE